MSCIIFWQHEHLGSEWYQLPIPAHEAAEKISVSLTDLVAAFRAWAAAGEPKEFFYKIGEEEGSIKAHDIFICIDEYLGLNSMSPELQGWGWISRQRSWGHYTKMISNSVKFTREILPRLQLQEEAH